MEQINVNIPMDAELNYQLNDLCDNLGLSMTVAFNIFAKAMVRQQKIPFEVSMNIPNEETIAAIEEIRQIKLDPNKKLYSNFSELLNEIDFDA